MQRELGPDEHKVDLSAVVPTVPEGGYDRLSQLAESKGFQPPAVASEGSKVQLFATQSRLGPHFTDAYLRPTPVGEEALRRLNQRLEDPSDPLFGDSQNTD